MRGLQLLQIDNRHRMRLSSVERAGVQHQRVPLSLLFGNVRVPGAHEVELTSLDGAGECGKVVAVDQGDLPPAERQPAKAPMEMLAGGKNRSFQLSGVNVDVSQHKMRGPGRKQRHDLGTADIAAMQYRFDLERRQHVDCLACEFHMAVGVADHANQLRGSGRWLVQIEKTLELGPQIASSVDILLVTLAGHGFSQVSPGRTIPARPI